MVPDDIFRILMWMFAKGDSTKVIAGELRLSERTVEEKVRRLRGQIAEDAGNQRSLLRGAVQVDTYTYRPKLTLKYAKRPILLALMGPGEEVRLFEIPKRTKSEIYPLVHAHIQRGSTLVTNGSNLYAGLRLEGFPDMRKFNPSEAPSGGKSSARARANLADFWQELYQKMGEARGVRSSTFIPRVREIELRWNYQRRPTVDLFLHLTGMKG